MTTSLQTQIKNLKVSTQHGWVKVSQDQRAEILKELPNLSEEDQKEVLFLLLEIPDVKKTLPDYSIEGLKESLKNLGKYFTKLHLEEIPNEIWEQLNNQMLVRRQDELLPIVKSAINDGLKEEQFQAKAPTRCNPEEGICEGCSV